MTIALPPEIQKLIEDRVRSGRYASVEDFITAAVCQLDQQDRLAELSTAELEAAYPGIREKLAAGLAEAKAGKLTDGDEFFEELKREYQDRDDTQSESAR
jgi:Arc/MetJ-type ribon-helix-helix transcriptional regulator